MLKTVGKMGMKMITLTEEAKSFAFRVLASPKSPVDNKKWIKKPAFNKFHAQVFTTNPNEHLDPLWEKY